jgi:DNA modification methylase
VAISIRIGSALACLRAMPADSVHCVVTSPPYWGLRDYGTPPQVWGGEPDCRHRWGAERHVVRSGGTAASTLGDEHWGNSVFADGIKAKVERRSVSASQGAFCQRCGAWRGSLGLEPTYQLYVDHLVAVLREVRRVLRPDGTLWLNLGDCYAMSTKGAGGRGKQHTNAGSVHADRRWRISDGLKPKDLVGIPWRVAFALQDDGWWLRRDNVWHKPNPMPESTKDRCTSSHEYLFHLSKSDRYFYDGEAIKEPASDTPGARAWRKIFDPLKQTKEVALKVAGSKGGNTGSAAIRYFATRNKRSVWTIATSPYPEAHFATFPPALVEPCILAGTSARGVCPKCGAPWVRVVEKSGTGRIYERGACAADYRAGTPQHSGSGSGALSVETQTIGWRPSCPCGAAEPVPATVLDPFLGAGTTALVANRLGRDCIGIELNPAYAAMAKRRTGASAPKARTPAKLKTAA